MAHPEHCSKAKTEQIRSNRVLLLLSFTHYINDNIECAEAMYSPFTCIKNSYKHNTAMMDGSCRKMHNDSPPSPKPLK